MTHEELRGKADKYAKACAASGNRDSTVYEISAAVPELIDRLAKSGDALADMTRLASRCDAQRLAAIQERDAVREQLATAERELERWRHGITIESDFVCPNEPGIRDVERDAFEAVAVMLDRKAELFVLNKHLGPYSAELAAEVRAMAPKTDAP